MERLLCQMFCYHSILFLGEQYRLQGIFAHLDTAPCHTEIQKKR